jgi:hypothetical protein
MDNDDLTYTTSISGLDVSTISMNDYVDFTDTIDLSSITDSITITTTDYEEYNQKRMDVRDNGKIPVDIWARMYNNGNIDD